MNRCIFLFILLAGIIGNLFTLKAQSLKESITLFLNNEFKASEAQLTLLSKEAKDPEERAKSAIALALIHKLNENDEEKVRYFVEGICGLSNPDPYVYTLWGHCTFYNYPRFANRLQQFYASRNTIHPDISYCLDNLKRRLFIRHHQLDSAIRWNMTRGYIHHWEFLGPFDYDDGYGYHQDEGTLQHPETNYTFITRYGAPLSWWPMVDSVDVSPVYLNEHTDIGGYSAAKIYAQSFIESDQDRWANLNLVCGTDIRCWLNDQLVYENRKNIENIGSLPVHIRIHLKKGNNRLLIQCGKKSGYQQTLEVSIRDTMDVPMPTVKDQLQKRTYQKLSGKAPGCLTDPDIESFNVKAFSDYLKLHEGDLLEHLLQIEELNSTGDKEKTLKALMPLYQKYPNSHYLANLFYNNKPNINYTTKDDYLNQSCKHCFSTLNRKFLEASENDDKDGIQSSLDSLEKYFPGNETVIQHRIDHHLNQDEYIEAEKLIEEGLRRSSHSLVYPKYKATLLKYQARKTEHYNYLISLLPFANQTFVTEKLKEAELDKDDTLSWIQRQLDDIRYDKNDELLYNLWKVYKSGRKYKPAEYLLNQFLSKKPYSAGAWETLGDLWLAMDNRKEAIRCFEKSLIFFPSDYNLIKKIKTAQTLKPEIERLFELSLRDAFQKYKLDKLEVPQSLIAKNWVILIKKTASVMYSPSVKVSKTMLFYKVLNEAGINEFKEFSGSYAGADVLVFKKDGSVVLPESGSGSMVIPDLQVDDIIGVSLNDESVGSNEYLSTRYIQFLNSFDNDPMILSEDDHLVAKSILQQPMILNPKGNQTPEKKSWNEDFLLYTWKNQHPALIEPELFATPASISPTAYIVHNYATWDEVTHWYADISAHTLEANDSIRTLVQSIMASQKSINQFEKARLLYQWIVRNINYSSQSFRQDNFVPQIPAKVLRDKLGDCKDLSALFLVMCREAGIQGHFALINMEQRATLFKAFPNRAFNHCIAYIYADGKPYWVELTSKFLPFAHTPNYAFYAYGLVVDTSKPARILTPINQERRDWIAMRSNIREQESSITMEGTIQLCGVTGAILKEAFEKIDSNQIQTGIKKLVSDLIPGTRVESAVYDPGKQDTLSITYKAGSDAIFTDVLDLYIYKLPVFLNKVAEESMLATPDRKTDLSFFQATGMMGEASDEIRILIPPGKQVLKKTLDTSIQNEFLNYAVKLEQQAGVLRIQRKLTVHQLDIPAPKYQQFKSDFERAFKADLVTVVLQ